MASCDILCKLCMSQRCHVTSGGCLLWLRQVVHEAGGGTTCPGLRDESVGIFWLAVILSSWCVMSAKPIIYDCNGL